MHVCSHLLLVNPLGYFQKFGCYKQCSSLLLAQDYIYIHTSVFFIPGQYQYRNKFALTNFMYILHFNKTIDLSFLFEFSYLKKYS